MAAARKAARKNAGYVKLFMTRPFPFLKGEVRAAMTNPAVKQRIHGDAKSTANTECATWLQLIRGQGTNPETPTFVLHLVTDTAKTFPSEAKLLTTDPFEIPDAEDKDKEVDPSILKNALKKKWEEMAGQSLDE